MVKLDMVTEIISFILSNIPLVCLMLALIISAFQIGFQHRSKAVLLAWLLLLPVGVAGLWAFIFHAFFPSITDNMIGWAYSPFEFEVAMANLGMSALGVLGFRSSLGFQKAGVLFTAIFLWGAAVGHIYQMVSHHNFDPGNAGAIFWTDILIPIVLIVALNLKETQDGIKDV
ncbi:MAG: DUF6790 family protein [Myxococcota bacterium]